jgi:hypothetical protein
MCFDHPFIVWALLPWAGLFMVWTEPLLNIWYPQTHPRRIGLGGYAWRVLASMVLATFEMACISAFMNPC